MSKQKYHADSLEAQTRYHMLQQQQQLFLDRKRSVDEVIHENQQEALSPPRNVQNTTMLDRQLKSQHKSHTKSPDIIAGSSTTQKLLPSSKSTAKKRSSKKKTSGQKTNIEVSSFKRVMQAQATFEVQRNLISLQNHSNISTDNNFNKNESIQVFETGDDRRDTYQA